MNGNTKYASSKKIQRTDFKSKPSNKNKVPPVVKQTLTSKYRILKANPLLRLELESKIATNSGPNGETLLSKPLRKLAQVMNCPNGALSYGELFDTAKANTANPTAKKQKNETILRRSISAQELSSHVINKQSQSKTLSKYGKTSGSQPLLSSQCSVISTGVKKISPIASDTRCNKYSVYKTPLLPNNAALNGMKSNNRRTTFSKAKPKSEEISIKLSEWLNSKGKRLNDYHHLNCFGITINDKKTAVCQDKENIPENTLEGNTTMTDFEAKNMKILEFPVNNKTEDQLDAASVARDALTDLQNLMKEGYPAEQCDVWLKLIKQKCPQLEKEATYWECRALLEESRSNFPSAVECYKIAIVQGAEVPIIDNSLDKLLQKFSLLDIKAEVQPTVPPDRTRIIEDARKVFKSTIIQFAVQQKKLKKGAAIEKSFVATPVRRSTRLSRSAYTSTPSVKIYNRLDEIDSPVRQTLTFQHNQAL